jgi:hypothetical protein
MQSRIKNVVFVSCALFLGFIGWNSYNYFFSTGQPTVTVSGLESEGFYCGDVQCIISGADRYKVADVSIWLDGHPLINKFKINAKECEHPFTIPTRTIANGKHTLKVELCNGTYKKVAASLERTFFVDNQPLQAAFIKPETDYKVLQGRTLHVQVQVSKDIKEMNLRTLSHVFPCFQESATSLVYECFVPIACEDNPNEYLLSVDITDHVNNKLTLDNKFQIVPYPFKKQTIQVAADKLKQEKEMGKATQEFEHAVEKLVAASPKEKLWHGAFCTPIDVKGISTEFGTMRTTQERGRYMHKGVDVLNAPKSVVWSSQDGTVVLKDRFELSGNTVIVDHGWGIFSLFYHLDDFANDLKVGDRIKKGNPVGMLGKTGYANGYHLHWEMRINNTAVDPMQWANPTF